MLCLQKVIDHVLEQDLEHCGSLTTCAVEGYANCGRGALVHLYSSIQGAIDDGVALAMYQPTCVIDLLGYPAGSRLVEEYDPTMQFILIAGVHRSNGKGVFKGVRIPREGIANVETPARMLQFDGDWRVKPCARAGCSAGYQHVCGRCHGARYCSEECQRSDWRHHRQMCALIAVLKESADF